jgi:hypothetical protein
MIKKFVLNALLIFFIAFITTAFVTLLWNLFIDKNGAIVDWRTSTQFAVIMGIVLPLVIIRSK